MKDKLLKSPAFLCILLLGICLLGFIAIKIVISPTQTISIDNQNETSEETTFYTNYDWNKLETNGYFKYEDDYYTSKFGIDVAAHQDVIDWNKVAQSGVEFAYIRLGYRGASEGILHLDEQFEYNYQNAKDAGLLVGIYWYSQPIDEIEATAEADFVIETLNGRQLDLPIAYDLEETVLPNQYSRIHGMSKNDCTAVALAFSNEMNANGYETILYTNAYWSDNYYDWDILNNYNVWYAQYDTQYPQFDKPMLMWQYSDSGSIPGIQKNCDLDILFIKKNG